MSIEWNNIIATVVATAAGATAIIPVEIWRGRLRRTVKCHVAVDLQTKQETLYVKVVNNGSTKATQVTHVYLEIPYEGRHRRSYCLIKNYENLGMLSPAMEQEFCCPVSAFYGSLPSDPWRSVRVRFTDGRVVRAEHNADVPAAGNAAPQSFELEPVFVDGTDRLLAFQ